MSLYKDASLVMIPSAYKDGKLYSIRPTDGSGDFTFSRGSNLAATRVDVNGLIEKGRENQFTYSNTFSNSSWLKADTSVTGGQSGYDGSNDAWLLEITGSTGFQTIRKQPISYSGVNTFSFYAKAGTLSWLRVNTSVANTYFDIGNGVVGSTDSSIGASIEAAGNGYYRCIVPVEGSSSVFYIYPASGNGNVSQSSGNLYIQDAQLEQGLVATDYIETGTSAAQSGILEDMPRLDYSGGASCPSLLLEPQRSNIQPYSEYFGSSFWQKTDVSLDFGYLAPDGTNSAYKITKTGSNAHLVNATTSGNTGNTKSIYAKTTSGTGTVILFNNVTTYFTITDEWQRFDIQHDGLDFLYYAVDFRGVSTLTEILIWGAQSESGSYPTSYIPTYGTSQTRSGESCVATSVSDLIGQEQGTLFLEAKGFADEYSNNTYTSITNSTGSNRIIIGIASNSNQLRIVGVFGGVSNGGNNYTITDTTTYFKVAVKYYNSTLDVFVNGVKQTSQSFAGFSNAVDAVRFDDGNGALPFEGDIKQRLIFPTALTDSECIALTTL